MSRKSRFEIAPEVIEAGESDDLPGRRLGPMATAIRETADSVRREQEETQYDELAALRLAARMKKLLEAELDLRMAPISEIDQGYLTRDRKRIDEEGLAELKASIRETELRSPIRLEEGAGGALFLIEGLRRLRAFEELHSETGEERFARIPALVSPAGSVDRAYRSMVDENLVREDISFGELAALALAFADRKGVDVDAAIEHLFASTSRQKRWTIREFAKLLAATGTMIQFPEALTKHLGVALAKRIDEDGFVETMREALAELREQEPASEAALLERLVKATRAGESGRGRAKPDVVKFRVVLDGDRKRRFDVALTKNRLVISGVDASKVSEEAVRRFLKSL
jgi:ParB family chromosome partitioning protein